MGWRERDWARLTDDERRAIYGGDGARRAPGVRSSRGISIRTAAGWAIVASAVLFLLGHVPDRHPLVPALHFKLPGPAQAQSAPPPHYASPRYVHLLGPRIVPVGSLMTTRGYLDPALTGRVLVQARWKPHAWKTIGGTYVRKGKYVVRYRLTRRGVAHVRIALPGRLFAIATIRVN